MSQRIVTECDPCAHEGVTRDGLPEQISALGRSFVIDLCEQHEKELRTIVDGLADLGRPMPGNGRDRRSSRTVCPRCGRTFATARALGVHTKREYGETVAEARAATAPPPQSDFTCPDDGRTFGSKQALSMHRFRTHGERSNDPSAAASRARKARARAAAPDGGRAGE